MRKMTELIRKLTGARVQVASFCEEMAALIATVQRMS